MSNGNGNGDGTTHAELGLRGRVVVVGAGIAGLTAAHELVERGFEVEVVESDFIRIDLCDEEGNVTGHEWIPRIGGMARTQWVRPPEVAGDVELEEAPHDTSDSAIAFDSQPSGSENAIDPAQITDQVLAESVAYCQHPDSRMRVHYVDSAPEIQHRRAELAAWEAARDSFAPALALWRELAAAAQRKERGAKSEQERLRQELAEPTRELERALQHQHRLGPIQAEFALELDRVLTGIDEADASGDWRRQRRLERRKAELEARLGPLREELDRAADIIADRDPFVASRRDLLAAARGRADGSMTAAYGDKLAQLDDAVTKILVESVARERFQGTMNPDIRRDLECLFAPLRPGDANERIAALRDAYRGPLPPPDVEQELTRLLEVRGVLTQQRPTPGLAPVDYYDRLLQELKDLRYVPDPPTDERREWELLERFKVALPLFGHLLSPIHIADGTVARRVMKLVGCLDPTLTGDRLVTTYEVLDGSTQAASNTSEGPTGGAVVAADTATPAEGTVTLELAARTVPAEHGFRFYPSFYLHLFDTLSRIPLERGWEYREGRAPVGTPFPEASLFHPPSAPRRMIDDYRTVLQNLVPAKVFRFGLDRDAREIHDPEGLHRHRSWSANRRPPRTVAELREHFTNLLDDTGYSGESVARFARRLVEYATSCEERRQDLEKVTFKEFVKTEELDPRLREHIESSAQALVAMSSDKNDARTIAYIALQLNLDMVVYREFVDGILNGPTSLEWFRHWKRYLESQGVGFTPGRLVAFEELEPENQAGEMPLVRPIILRRKGAKKPDVDPPKRVTDVADYELDQPSLWERVAPGDYTVLALPVDKLQWVVDNVPSHAVVGQQGELLDKAGLLPLSKDFGDWYRQTTGAPEWRDDFERQLTYQIHDPPRSNLSDPPEAPDDGPLRWMVGIQFFFPSEVRLVRGHTMCADSAWSVTYLSQPQYWRKRARFYDGYRGVVSAIISRFDKECKVRVDSEGNTLDPIKAKDAEKHRIAYEVWAQIQDTLDDEEKALMGRPSFFHIDENLRPEANPPGQTLWHNQTEYLVNHVDDWDKRPGRRTADGDYEYDLQLGHTVFAGVFMRTHTRLTTMESANESGRRATNGILREAAPDLRECDVFRLENEIDLEDLEPLRRIDGKMYVGRSPTPEHILGGTLAEWSLRATPWELARLFQRRRKGT